MLQPCANKAAQEHYQSTVRSPVRVNDIVTHLSRDEESALRTFASDGAIALWGAKPGEDGRNAKRWRRVAPGDYLFFVHGSGNVSVAEVAYTLHNPALASKLWGTTSTANGVVQTWEYMFALGPASDLILPTVRLNEIIGRKYNAAVQEFVVLDAGPSADLVSALNLRDSPANPTVPDPGAPAGRRLRRGQPDREFDQLDEIATGLRRKEQAYLRRYILPGNAGECALCERVMPIEFLVAAHIKKRSECSDVERRDFSNIAMPNCKLGCDELFGRGLISVDQGGMVRISSKAPDVGPIRVYIDQHLRGKTIRFWDEKPRSRAYFAHHYAEDFVAS